VRGYRIELGEIEARLIEQANVSEVLVQAQKRGPSTQLIGFVVRKDLSESGADFSQRLLQHVQGVLPSYMVPSRLLVLDQLPRLSSGKVDLQRLPAITEDTSRRTAPRTPAEEVLVKIWQDVLGVPQVGVHDNFYELGGDSIQSLKVLARLRDHANVLPDIKLRDLMQFPTISSLALRADSGTPRPQPLMLSPLVALNQHQPSQPTLFCVHPGMGTIFDYRMLANRLAGHVNVFGIQSRMLIDPNWTDRSITVMAEDYVNAIREAQPQGAYRLLGWSLGGTLAIEMTHILQRSDQQVDLLALVDPFIPLGENVTPPTHLSLPEGLETQEAARIATIAKHLRRLSARATLKIVATRPHCWWSSERTPGDAAVLEQAIGQTAVWSSVLSSNHWTMPTDPDFLQSLCRFIQS
jgi:pimeloyl-ACP methyl ester carboxylesterase